MDKRRCPEKNSEAIKPKFNKEVHLNAAVREGWTRQRFLKGMLARRAPSTTPPVWEPADGAHRSWREDLYNKHVWEEGGSSTAGASRKGTVLGFSHHVLNGELVGDCEVGTRWRVPREFPQCLGFQIFWPSVSLCFF